MKVKFCNDNRVNIHSQVTHTLDLEKDLWITDQEWRAMSEEQRMEMVEDWAMSQFEFWYEEI